MTPDRRPSRRGFLKTGAVAAAALSTTALARGDENGSQKVSPPLPTRKLGRSGVPVSVLNLGTAFKLSQRMLDYAYNKGVRYLDTADCYEHGGSEREIGRWFERTGKRKEMFLVTKCHPRGGPKQMIDMIDERLEALKTDYIDLFFMHELCDSEYPKGAEEWPRSAELKETAEKLKKSGKCKLVGFSVHADVRAKCLTNAAEGGFVDAIMFKYDPRTKKNDKMNAAIDRCAKAGVGLIAMKTQSSSSAFADRWKDKVKSAQSVQQAVVRAVLSDERLTGMTSHMVSFNIIDENTAAARETKPLAAAEYDTLMGLFAEGPHRICDACDGACSDVLGRPTALHDVARFVMYHDVYGQRDLARRNYQALPVHLVNLTAEELRRARAACRDALDYPAIFARARKLFA